MDCSGNWNYCAKQGIVFIGRTLTWVNTLLSESREFFNRTNKRNRCRVSRANTAVALCRPEEGPWGSMVPTVMNTRGEQQGSTPPPTECCSGGTNAPLATGNTSFLDCLLPLVMGEQVHRRITVAQVGFWYSMANSSFPSNHLSLIIFFLFSLHSAACRI